MATKLIGFGISKGSFTNKSSGEVIDYSNRTLRFITDDGQNKDNVGWSGYEESKVKLSDLANSLGVKELDSEVDAALSLLCFEPVEVLRTPKNNELVCVGVKSVK